MKTGSKGFSIISILVFASLLAIMSVGFAQLFKTGLKGARTIQSKAAFSDQNNVIRLTLGNSAKCASYLFNHVGKTPKFNPDRKFKKEEANLLLAFIKAGKTVIAGPVHGLLNSDAFVLSLEELDPALRQNDGNQRHYITRLWVRMGPVRDSFLPYHSATLALQVTTSADPMNKETMDDIIACSLTAEPNLNGGGGTGIGVCSGKYPIETGYENGNARCCRREYAGPNFLKASPDTENDSHADCDANEYVLTGGGGCGGDAMVDRYRNAPYNRVNLVRGFAQNSGIRFSDDLQYPNSYYFDCHGSGHDPAKDAPAYSYSICCPKPGISKPSGGMGNLVPES